MAKIEPVELVVWWVPQVPMPSFEWPVPDLKTGTLLLDVLAKYDLFQLEHNVKPDYSNAGGLKYRHPIHTEGEWWCLDPEDENEVAEFNEILLKIAMPLVVATCLKGS